MQPPRITPLLAFTGLALILSTGCGVQSPPLQVGTPLSGNWAFTSSNPAMALNLGFTQGSYETASAVARLNGSSCISPETDIVLTGSVDAANNMTLVSSPFAGTTLTLKGQVAADGTGMAAANWTFNGGNCGEIGAQNVTATNYSDIAGTYSGNFTDSHGSVLPVSAFLQQTTQPNGDGQFTLSGTATFPSNTCFVQQPTLTQSQVTGGALSMTYVDPGSSAVLTASGTFNSTATSLKISEWSIHGGACNGDAGTGSLATATSVQ